MRSRVVDSPTRVAKGMGGGSVGTGETAPSFPLAEIDLSDLDGFWGRPPAERHAAFATLRAEAPVAHFSGGGLSPDLPDLAWGELEYWAVSRYEDVVAISRDPERFCSGQGATSLIDLPPAFLAFFGGLINADDPHHARLRRIVSRAFTPRVLDGLEVRIARRARAIVDEIAALGSCDFVIDVAARLPLGVLCDLMGIPEEEHDRVLVSTNQILGAMDPELLPEGVDPVTAVLAAGADLRALMQSLGESRRTHPTGDVTSALVNAEVEGERLSDDELASFFILLVVAGNETTRNAASAGLVALCEHPAERERWQAAFDARAPLAIEEIVRWATPVVFMRRTTTTETVVAGTRLPRGARLMLLYDSANRDPEAFVDPDRFDLGRTPNRHVGFGGFGPHYCLGAHLARRELTLLFREVLGRLPDITVVGEPVRLRSNFINGIKHLPCAFTPETREPEIRVR